MKKRKFWNLDIQSFAKYFQLIKPQKIDSSIILVFSWVTKIIFYIFLAFLILISCLSCFFSFASIFLLCLLLNIKFSSVWSLLTNALSFCLQSAFSNETYTYTHTYYVIWDNTKVKWDRRKWNVLVKRPFYS